MNRQEVANDKVCSYPISQDSKADIVQPRVAILRRRFGIVQTIGQQFRWPKTAGANKWFANTQRIQTRVMM